MTIFFVTFGIIVFLVFIMAIGVLFGRKPIAGSCRGYEDLGVECGAGCSTPCAKRQATIAKARAEAGGFTFFDVLGLAVLVYGAILGVRYGISWFGTVGGIVGFFVGVLAGFVIGRLPFAIAWFFARRSLSEMSNEALREDLQTRYYISHLLLAQLMVRGEDVTNEIPLFLDWMRSETSDKRKFGWAALQLVSPEMAEKIREFDFNDSTEKCRELVARIAPEETS